MLLYDKSIVGTTSRAPTFVLQLAIMLAQQDPAQLRFGVLGGRLAANATRLQPAEPDGAELIAVDIVFERSAEVMMVESVLELPLSPLQRDIALYAMLGNTRASCPAEFGVTEEALKKHLKIIFHVTRSGTWRDLRSAG